MPYALKRPFDTIAAGIALVALTPLLAILAATIALTIGRPVLYRQRRLGKNGQTFTIHKFRTMIDAWDQDGHPLPDEARLTRLGTFLRRLSLDELPELWDVVCGRMSLVGPRPLLVEYLPLYTPDQARRHDVRPGITGLAQVRGRNSLNWEERFRLDTWYVNHCSLWLDLKILVLTPLKVLSQEGITGGGRATMEPFRGSSARPSIPDCREASK